MVAPRYERMYSLHWKPDQAELHTCCQWSISVRHFLLLILCSLNYVHSLIRQIVLLFSK